QGVKFRDVTAQSLVDVQRSKMLANDIQSYIDELTKSDGISSRDMVEVLEDISDSIKQIINASVATGGTSVGLAVLGTILLPFTFGGSAALIGLGAAGSIAATGVATSVAIHASWAEEYEKNLRHVQ
ncbi:7403_t:CDS:2, partial [Ambispora leptoticha]